MAQTVLQGKVVDDTGEALIGATVKVLKGTDLARGTITDYEGNFRVNLDAGTYSVEVSYTGYQTSRTDGVRVLTNQLNFLDLVLGNSVLTEVVITQYKVPLIEQDKTQGGQTLTSEQIRNLPTRSVNAIVATTAGVTSVDGGEVNIKGSRSNATNYYIDGIRVYGNSVPPVQDIEQLQVITGGLGAEYGDVTGGVISVITKGPASEYHGAVEVENSYGLDPYGWLLANANLSGPLLKRKGENGATTTVVGFRLSGQYLAQKDDDPPATPIYRPKASVLENLEANPLSRQNGNIVNTAEQLTNDSIDVLDFRPYEKRRDIDLTGKLDFRVTDNIDFSVTGTYRDVQNQFTPAGWGILNSPYNPTANSSRWRTLARFRHRLGSNEAQKEASNKISISNASYQLQFGFERANTDQADQRHGQRMFDYGYIGRFGFDFIPTFGLDPNDPNRIVHNDNLEAFTGFQQGYESNGQTIVPNQTLVNYNAFANEEIFSSYLNQNGRFAGAFDDVWSGMYSNIGQSFNRIEKSENDVITIMASASFDLKLGRSGTHNIQFGLLNEQRTNRFWAVAPNGLWNLATLQANSHFNGLDTTNVIGQIFIPFLGDSIDQYGNAVTEQADNKFYRAVRQSLGLNIDDYVNVNSLTPDQLNLNMFSPRELTDQELVNYYGYDHLGNKVEDGVTFNDFFTSRATDGIRNFPVAPLRPVYQAAYLKDKFTFNKMIFSLGLRIERFDLNTRVMKDEFSLYEVMEAKEYFETVPGAGQRPANVGDDYKVYVNSGQDLSPKAFRDENNTWYFADGTQANDGNVVFGGGVVTPLVRDTVSGDDIFDPRFNPDLSFEDYTPQVNWLPRLAFSFPINENANFFAHYDILVQRPPSNWEVTPLNYLYFYVPGRTSENNANLRPERVVDYEVGFQQRLNQNSALKFSAYYREMRDMIQFRTILYIPTIGRYDTYGNIDFGTVKGFTVQYDLRRIQNAELRVAYTLQFADGTGSDAVSQRGLTNRGNIRNLYPLNFDERHNLNAILDYRFASGKAYNGPRINGLDFLSNFGVNIQALAISGRPYTGTIRPQRFTGEGRTSAINGSRLPWRFNIDVRVDKSFNLAAANKRPLNLNIYFRVSNLLDRRNVTGVYTATGSPTDDGYLASAEGQSVLSGVSESGRSEEAYLASYSWILLNPNNFTLPRRMYVGALFEF